VCICQQQQQQHSPWAAHTVCPADARHTALVVAPDCEIRPWHLLPHQHQGLTHMQHHLLLLLLLLRQQEVLLLFLLWVHKQALPDLHVLLPAPVAAG